MGVRIKLIFDGVDIKKCMFLVDSSQVLIRDLERRIKKCFLKEQSCKLCLFIDDFLIRSEDGIELIHDNDVIVVRVRMKSEETELADTSIVRKKNKKRKRQLSGVDELTDKHVKSSGAKNSKKNKVNEIKSDIRKKVDQNVNKTVENQVEMSKQKKPKIKRICGEEKLDAPNTSLNPHDLKEMTERKMLSKKDLKSSALDKVLDKDDKQTNKTNKPATDVHSNDSSGDSSSSSSSDDTKIKKKPTIKWNSKQKQTKQNSSNNQKNISIENKTPTVDVYKALVKVRQVKKNGDKKHIFFESDSESSCDDDVDVPLDDTRKETERICDSVENNLMVNNMEKGAQEKKIEELAVENEDYKNQEQQLEELEKPSNLPTAPIRDYSNLQPLIGPPRVGDVIGYKILELSASYMPEISAYKEGKVVEYDVIKQFVTLELCPGFTFGENMKREGRFEMELDEEYMEDNVQNENKVCVQWSAVMAPRLIT